MLDRVIILHDNAHPHIAISITTVFQEYDWEMLNQAPYNPDLSPSDYNQFPKLKEPFSDLSKLSLAMTQDNWRLNKTQLLHGIERLPEH